MFIFLETVCILLCVGTIKHASVNEKWADYGGFHSITAHGQQL